MQLISAFIRNPVKISVGVLLVVLFGSICMVTMPKQLTPEVQNPVLTVETIWRGASPQEVEREIIDEQEEQLKSVEGLVKLSSESMDSMGRITMEFAVGTDINEALLKVNTRLQQVRQYPVDALEPVISSSDVTDRAIARFVLTARPPEREQIAKFLQEHPELAQALEPVVRAVNPGLMVFRLGRLYEELGAKHPELRELLPPEVDLNKLRRFSEDVIGARLERVRGVSDAEVYGGLEEEMQVVVDPDQLAARGLTISSVRTALQSQNIDTSAGDFSEGKRRWVVRTLGQFRDPTQVEEQVLADRGGGPIFVKDVAQVQLGHKKPDSVSRRYGISTNGLSVRRESGANVLEVMEGLRAATHELNEGILKQSKLELFQYYDETEYIHSAIGLVQQNIFIGGALTMIVLMLCLHPGIRSLLITPLIAGTSVAAAYVSPWFFAATVLLVVGSGLWFSRGALVVGLAIPTCIVGTFLMLGVMSRSLNVISLAGLAFAVGMLVDNAVVVLENIHRRCRDGERPLDAAVRGTQEVWGAVVASTLTTVAVFLPVLFVEDMAGQLFRDIALAISCAVGLSMIVSFTVIPTAAARLFSSRRHVEDRPEDFDAGRGSGRTPSGNGDGQLPRQHIMTLLAERGRRLLVSVAQSVLGVLERSAAGTVQLVLFANRWIQAGTLRACAFVTVIVAATIGLTWLFWPKVEYLPAGNRNFVFAYISPPPGYNIDQLMEMGKRIETDLQPYWDTEPDADADALDGPMISYYFYVVRGRQVIMGARAADPSRVRELIPVIRRVGSQFPGTIVVAKQSSLFERGITGGRTIDIEITGPDLERLVDLGSDVLGQVRRMLPTAQALPQPSLDLSSPEVHVKPKLVQSAQLGISAQDLGYAVDALIDGAYAGDYFVGGDKIDLTVIGNGRFADRTQDLDNLTLATADGRLVPLSAIAEVSLASGPEQINRRERARAITIQVTPPATMPLEEAMLLITEEIIGPMTERGEFQGGYLVNLAGTADKLRDTWRALRWNVALALVITYLLMAALFESWLYPFVIIFSVPLGAVGGILGLRLLNVFVFQPLDVLTMLGFVILIGTVVNNAILIVHQSLNHIRFDALPPREAILESVRTRIRPIFITTMTTVLGLLPLVLFPGAGSELYRGLGSIVLGGLIVSSTFTLVVVPTVFILTMQAKEFLWRTAERPSASPWEMEPAASGAVVAEQES